MPTVFVPNAGIKRCTMHEYGCPTEDCPYMSNNKRVLAVRDLHRRPIVMPNSVRRVIWHRQEKKKLLANVFMTNSETMNCTFEPLTGSLNPHNKFARKRMDAAAYDNLVKEPTADQFVEKLGDNFKKLHPEVFKLGVLKRAEAKYKAGEFDKSMNILETGFNIVSLKKRF